MKARHYQHLMTDELVCNFGFMSCNELTNIKVNVKDKKLTPLYPTMKVHKKTLTNIGWTDVGGTLRRQDYYLNSGTIQLRRRVRRT